MAPNAKNFPPGVKLKTWHIVLIVFFSALALIWMIALWARSGKPKPMKLPADHMWNLSQDERIPTKTNKYPQPLRPKRHPSTEDDPEDATEMFKQLNKFKMKRDWPIYS